MYFNQFIYFNTSVIFGKVPSNVQYFFARPKLIALMPNIFYIFGINCATFSCQWYFFDL